jgi:peptidyl-prolyl cis-trans isomerase SurA
MKKKLFILLFFLLCNQVQSIETKIIHNIENEIITNIDIKNEFKYLVALNNSLKNLDKDQILNISNESIIREKIKKIEISKHFEKIKINEKYLDILLKNIYLRLNLKSINEFEQYLRNFNIKMIEFEAKITIDALWNELVIKKYGTKININKDKIQRKILENDKIQSKEFQLSEIIFEVTNKDEIEVKYNEIIKSIKDKGFENSAAIYSFSDSAKIGGNIGWIKENLLNEKIRNNINKLKTGEITKPIILSNGILVLKLINTKNSETVIDLENELKKAIDYERNRQMNQYSKIYYNKVKKNLDFNG